MLMSSLASRLKHRITLLDQPKEKNSYGEIEENGTWPELATVWAEVKFLQGRELFQANQVHNEVTAKVVIHFRKDVKPNMRVKYGSRILEIVSPPINVNEENRYLELFCKELV